MKRKRSRGFALLFIVMIVAVVAVAAAALLDIVEVDLLIAGEYRRSALADSVVEGAIYEFQADANKANLLPTSDSLNLSVRYTDLDAAGVYVRDPDGLDFGPVPLDETTSAYVRNNTAAAQNQQGYSSQLRLLRFGPALDNGVNTVKAVLYEVRAQATVGTAQSTSEVLVQAYTYAPAQNGTVGEVHAR